MREKAYSDPETDTQVLRRSPARMVRTSTPGIYKRGSRYVVVFYDQTGKQRKRSARNLRDARTLKTLLQADVARGDYLADTRITFAEYAATWIANYDGRTARGIRPGTLNAYRDALGLDPNGQPNGRGAIAHLGPLRLAAVRATDIKAYAAHLAAKGRARNTIRIALAPVKAMLATAAEESLIRSNPAAGLRLGRLEGAPVAKPGRALTEEEVIKLLAELPTAYRPLIEFLVQTGLRVSEAQPLTKADVDLERRRVRITKRLYQGGLDAPKSRHGLREVSLTPAMADRLRKQLEAAPDDTLLFPSRRHGPIGRSTLHRVVRTAGERAGIEWAVGLHTLRHSAASIMWRRGVNREQIRRVLGHQSWDFTATNYVHLGEHDIPDGSIMSDLVAEQPEIGDDAASGISENRQNDHRDQSSDHDGTHGGSETAQYPADATRSFLARAQD